MFVFLLVIYIIFAIVGWFLEKIRLDQDFVLSKCSKAVTAFVGVMGSGKDLACQYVAINTDYISNISYGNPDRVVSLQDLSLAPNNYTNFVAGQFHQLVKKPYEGKTYIISEAGLNLPNFADKDIKARYPWLSLFVALARHLYNMPIIWNAQDADRPVLLFREQTDDIFLCRGGRVMSILGYKVAIIDMTYYSKYKAYRAEIEPISVSLFSSEEEREEAASLRRSFGEVRSVKLVYLLPDECYDTRYFHRVFFGSSIEK